MSDNLNRRNALKGALGAGVLGALALGGASSAEAAQRISYPYIFLRAVSYHPLTMESYYYGKPLSSDSTIRSYQSDSIRNIQRRLGLTQDGVFGPKTDGAVRSMQRIYRITVDGRVGTETANVLGLEQTE